MNEVPPTIEERYGMRRPNFILDPVEDIECFVRNDIDTGGIAESLEVDLVTGLAPKRLVWGPYGGGKTHTLMRTMHELEKLIPVYPVRVECPDLSKKSRFHDLYREGIMRSLGEELVRGLIEETVESVGLARREKLLKRLCERFKDQEIAKAAIRIIDPNFDPLRLWRWISGVPMSRTDLDDLGQTQDLTQAEAARLSGIICMFGRILREQRKQTLVLILDEMERLRAIGPDSITTFVSGFTRLVDPSQVWVSVLIGASAQLQTEMVEVFSENTPVASRIGAEAQIEIPALEDSEVDSFITGIISFVREPNADFTALVNASKKGCAEDVSQDLFPFSIAAIDTLKSHLTQLMTPREITMKMTRALGRAHRSGRRIITSDCVA